MTDIEEKTQQAIALVMSGTAVAILILANCLKNTGALDDGRFERALEKTINAPDAEADRPDYQLLARILALLQGETPSPFRVIQGGKP